MQSSEIFVLFIVGSVYQIKISEGEIIRKLFISRTAVAERKNLFEQYLFCFLLQQAACFLFHLRNKEIFHKTTLWNWL